MERFFSECDHFLGGIFGLEILESLDSLARFILTAFLEALWNLRRQFPLRPLALYRIIS